MASIGNIGNIQVAEINRATGLNDNYDSWRRDVTNYQ